MNIVMYGFGMNDVRPLAERYGFSLCDSFESLENGHRILLQEELATREKQLTFFENMADYDRLIDAVICVPNCASASTVYYCSRPDKFFTVDAGGEDPDYTTHELVRIIETQLGLLCAHECV
ncbi:MAG: hypothetical protein J6K95_06745 [Rikenellaceae bacterium]|nr:hypothetical protein [Rikenellaceae bacterium]